MRSRATLADAPTQDLVWHIGAATKNPVAGKSAPGAASRYNQADGHFDQKFKSRRSFHHDKRAGS